MVSKSDKYPAASNPRVDSGMRRASNINYNNRTNEDFNDRLIESPKARSYVPLLSKKLKSKNSGSTQNVHAAIEQRTNSSIYGTTANNDNFDNLLLGTNEGSDELR